MNSTLKSLLFWMVLVVVGAGPAGLSAAYFLAKKGYHPTIFEKAPFAGGMLRAGIPDYRLPPAILDLPFQPHYLGGIRSPPRNLLAPEKGETRWNDAISSEGAL